MGHCEAEGRDKNNRHPDEGRDKKTRHPGEGRDKKPVIPAKVVIKNPSSRRRS